MNLLLDTCTFLWVLSDPDALSPRARDAITDRANEVALSAVSAWEIAIKHGLGKLPLPAGPEKYVPEQRQRHGVVDLPLEEAAVLGLSKLPSLHRDPFDRMLICQAIHHGLVLVTPDEQITQYPVRSLW